MEEQIIFGEGMMQAKLPDDVQIAPPGLTTKGSRNPQYEP
jgi:hypothetical protein